VIGIPSYRSPDELTTTRITTHRADALPPDLWSAQVPGTFDVAESYLRNPTWLLD
jgi:hypothetical protein